MERSFVTHCNSYGFVETMEYAHTGDCFIDAQGTGWFKITVWNAADKARFKLSYIKLAVYEYLRN